MSKALSIVLRERVVRTVAEGASCRAAAAVRFGVSASSAIRWCARLRARGSVVPGRLGGDRRSGRIEAHAGLIPQQVERTPDLTLAELEAALAECGVAAGIATLGRFLSRHPGVARQSETYSPRQSGEHNIKCVNLPKA